MYMGFGTASNEEEGVLPRGAREKGGRGSMTGNILVITSFHRH